MGASNRPEFETSVALDDSYRGTVEVGRCFATRITNTGKSALKIHGVLFEWRGRADLTNSCLNEWHQSIEPGTATITRCEVPFYAEKFRVTLVVCDEAGPVKKKTSELVWKIPLEILAKYPQFLQWCVETETLRYYPGDWISIPPLVPELSANNP